jgi:hypothetical protein
LLPWPEEGGWVPRELPLEPPKPRARLELEEVCSELGAEPRLPKGLMPKFLGE